MRMPKSVIKCIRCHFGYTIHNTHVIDNSAIPEVKSYSDLGVMRSSSNDSLEHISYAVKRARRLSDLILCSFASRDTAFLMQIFQLYEKSILMYVRFPIMVALAKISIHADIESVQRRFTKRLQGLSNLALLFSSFTPLGVIVY